MYNDVWGCAEILPCKVSFCSDGADDRIKFVTLVSGFTVSSCAERFLIQCFPFFVFELLIDVQRF